MAAKGTKSSKVWKFDGKTCPKCNKSEVWDNRGKIASNEFSPKSPHFACRDKSCGWAVWEGQYEGNDTAEDTSDGAPVPYTPPTENNDIVKEAKDIMGVEEDYGTPEDAIEG